MRNAPCFVTVIAAPDVTIPKSGGRGAILNTLRMSWAEDLISIDCKKLFGKEQKERVDIKIDTYIAQYMSYELLCKCIVLSFSNKETNVTSCTFF
jgi:hypothetical protein